MTSPAIDDLRRQMREKFPQAHASPVFTPTAAGQPELKLEPGVFPAGAISEVIGRGIGMLVAGLLGEPDDVSPLPEFILIDGGDAFDPASFTPAVCSRLLWVRCHSVPELLKSADLVVRDGNVPFILLDTCGISSRDLGAIPASSWWRLKLAAEATQCRVVVMSAMPQVPCAAMRLALNAGLKLTDFPACRRDLVATLRVVPQRIRRAN